jgi:hypothetical protein
MATESSKPTLPSPTAKRLDRVLVEFAATLATVSRNAALIADQLLADLDHIEVEMAELTIGELRAELRTVEKRCNQLWKDVVGAYPNVVLSQEAMTRFAIVLSGVKREREDEVQGKLRS